MNTIQPLSVKEFNEIAKNATALNISDYEAFFEKEISEASTYAVGPFFWFIGNNHEMKIVSASKNIGDLTPFSHKEWTNATALFLTENLHPEDSLYVLSALSLAVKKIEELPSNRQKTVRVNIYARMLNAAKEYRWVLLQMPGLHISIDASTCGIIMITDLSHLSFNQNPVLMTFTDKIANQNVYYHVAKNANQLEIIDFPTISNREHDILKCMAKGLNSPEIAQKLFISYHTVENHKRNLRKKTNTKTSAELINYVWSNNLI